MPYNRQYTFCAPKTNTEHLYHIAVGVMQKKRGLTFSSLYFLWEKSNKQEETQAQEEIAWGDTYIKILEDEDFVNGTFDTSFISKKFGNK